jgi:hypothetical protein
VLERIPRSFDVGRSRMGHSMKAVSRGRQEAFTQSAIPLYALPL